MVRKPTYEALEARVNELEIDAVKDELNVLQDIPVGVSISSPDGKVTDINLTGLEMFGYTSKEAFLNSSAADHYYDPEDRERFKGLHKKGMAKDFETRFVRKDGSAFWGSITSVSRHTKGGVIQYINIFKDISRRVKAQERSEHLTRVLWAIRKVSQLINRETDRNRLIQGICNSLIETRGYYNAWIALMDPSGAVAATAEAGLGMAFEPMVGRLRQGALTACGKGALSEGGVVTIRDPASACRDCPLSTGYGNRGAMTVRLENEGRVFGLLSASIPSYLLKDTEEQMLFQEMAEDVAFALQGIEDRRRRIETEEKLQESERALRRANQNLEDRLQAVLSPGKSPDDLMVTDIMDVEILQEINRIFAEVFELTMLLTDADGKYLAGPANLSEFCQLIRQTDEGLKRCKASDEKLAVRVKEASAPVITRCKNAGLIDAALPIRIGGRHVASWLVGQFCPPEVDEASVRRTAQEIGADEKELISAFHKLKRRPVEHMEKALKMLDVFTQEISKYGLNNLKLMRAIAERKQVEEQLNESILRQREAVKAGNVGLWDWDLKTNKVLFSDEWKSQIGYEPDEISDVFEEWRSRVHPEDLEPTLKEVNQSIDEKRSEHKVEFRFRHKDGSYLWILAQASILQDKNGNPIRMLGSHIDITERKRAEEELRKSEGYFRLLAENATDTIWMMNLDGTFLYHSPSVEKLRGYTPEEANRVPMEQTMTPKSLALIHGIFEEENSKPMKQRWWDRTIELEMYRKDGSTIWTEVSARAVRDSEGIVVALQGGTRDITERRRAQELLRESEEKYRNLFEAGADAILFLKKDTGNIIEANTAAVELFGYRQEELHTLKLTDLSTEPEKTREALEKGLKMVPLRLYRKKDGTIFPVEIVGRDFVWKGKEVRIVSIRDITRRQKDEEEKKRLEAQLRRSQKMEAVSTLAGGIAHDFNNILAGILGYGTLAQMKLDPTNEVYADLEAVLQSGNRAKSLIQQILTIGRSQEQERQPLQLKYLVREALKFLRSTLPTTIEIQERIEKDTGLIDADPTQMNQVLMNLCTNAGHAMEKDGGTLTVSLQNEELRMKNEELGLEPGLYLRLSVSDTGYGIAPEIKEKIFDPYFTTKDVGEGTGIGLSVVHGIVEQHGGAITVESEPRKGSKFHVYLPLTQAEETEPEVKEETPLSRGLERILFVDDEATLAEMGKEILRSLGYEVTAMTSSLEALALFKEDPTQFDLVITDTTMPHMPGDILAHNMIKIRPDIPIIICTGYSKRISPEKEEEIGIKGFLMKPPAMRDLADMVRKVLDEE